LGEEGGTNEKEKKKLGSREIYIGNDLTQEKREVQRKLKEVAREEETNGKRTRVGYTRIEIEGQLYIWDEKENRIVKKRNFLRKSRKKGVGRGIRGNGRGREGRGGKGGSEKE